VLGLIGTIIVGGRDGLGYLGAKASGDETCRVTSVVDGDTVRVYCPGRGFDSARLTGYDTPEVYSPRCIGEWWAGMRATWALQRQLWAADEVRIVFNGTDRYDRRLAALFIDGTNVSRLMIDAGHARAYVGDRRSGWCG
jgi:endonuclease YncB( thermonuclease family)